MESNYKSDIMRITYAWGGGEILICIHTGSQGVGLFPLGLYMEMPKLALVFLF